MAWDQQGYYQDPYQPYGYDPSYGYDNYYYQGYEDPKEDSASEKLRRDKERLEAVESNRLYLKKPKKLIVKEEDIDLETLQIFFFEVMIETLEVNTDSDQNLGSDENKLSEISGRVKFLNSPYMEICEKGVVASDVPQNKGTEHIQAVGLAVPMSTKKNSGEPLQEIFVNSDADLEEKYKRRNELKITAKWENASGKSCLFAETPLNMVKDLEQYPVILQVMQSAMLKSGEEYSCKPLGHAQFYLPGDFSQSVIQSCKEGVVLPVSSTHLEVLDIKNSFGVKKGVVELLVRLSSFGPAIVTSFQSSGDDRKYEFKPSPVLLKLTNTKEREQTPRSAVLQSITAQKENTCGIAVDNNTILWLETDDHDGKNTSHLGNTRVFNCGYEKPSDLLKLQLNSDISLCKNILLPSVFKKLKAEQKVSYCKSNENSDAKKTSSGQSGYLGNWNNNKCKRSSVGNGHVKACKCYPLLISETHRKDNSYLGQLSRLSSDKFKENFKNLEISSPEFRGSHGIVSCKEEQSGKQIRDTKNVSRLRKVFGFKINEEVPLKKGCGMFKESTSCGCKCPEIKQALEKQLI